VQQAEAIPVVVYDFQAAILSSSSFHKAALTKRGCRIFDENRSPQRYESPDLHPNHFPITPVPLEWL
jgi:hypothetical protein